ncbi:putative MO25-like protein At5g47540 isoform X1 [Zingiber officinale]|uniref:putative MO25-like protein At5g47540 isoform X1 n=1 Tax=Zingiber officinale TaxID=94328 RepID=UPI001C4D47DA|nr:putative MO25-like protein At5g47540 isoform X1 [Zingiber officinale]
MSFFFKSSPRPKWSPAELARVTKESFLALDTSTSAKAHEEVEKNIQSIRQMLSGDGELEPNQDHVSQLTLEICKEDVIALFIHKLPTLVWDARKDLVYCWSILLRQNIDSHYCCVEYLESHLELLDFLVVCYNNKEIALNCGSMLRECIKYPTLAKCILESNSFELFFKYVELPTFDIASDALATFKDLLTKNETTVSQFLISHYDQFFELYEKLLTSPNYVTRRQSLKILSDFLLEVQNSQTMKRYIQEVRYLKIMMALLKDSSKNIQISAFHIFKVFVANPNKPRPIIDFLVENREELLIALQKLPASKGEEDDQVEEEKGLIIEEIEAISSLSKANK